MTNPDSVSTRRMRTHIAILTMFLLCLGGLACSSEDATHDTEAEAPNTEMESTPAETATETDAGPCALTKEQVSQVIGDSVTETFAQGNWGIASTCTYSTATAPTAIEVSSVASADLSSDRMFEGAQEVPNLGDEAVWVPGTSRLTVVDKSKNKLLRIGVGLPVSQDERLELAKAIAELALGRL